MTYIENQPGGEAQLPVQPIDIVEFNRAIRALDKAGGSSLIESETHPAVRALQGVVTLGNPETEVQLIVQSTVHDGGDPYSEHYRGSYTAVRPLLVWGDAGDTYTFDIPRHFEVQKPDFHTLREAAIADTLDQLRFYIDKTVTRAGEGSAQSAAAILIQRAADQAASEAQAGFAVYLAEVQTMRNRFTELQQLAIETGLPKDDRFFQLRTRDVTNLLDMRYGEPETFERARRGISLEGMRHSIAALEDHISTQYEQTTGETLEEYERSKRGEILVLPPEEEQAQPHELSFEDQFFHARELLRRYRHSGNANEAVVQQFVAGLRGVTAGIDYKILRYHRHKIGVIELGRKEGMEQMLLELRKLNGYEVPEPTRFDALRAALRGVPVMDGNELQIQQDEYALIEQLIRFAELNDQMFTPEAFDDLGEGFVAGLERAIKFFRFAGERTNQQFQYGKNRRHGREAIEGLLSSIMHAAQYAYPALNLRPDRETGQWGIYPRISPSVGDIKRYAKDNKMSWDEARDILEGEYKEATQQLAIKGQVQRIMDYLLQQTEAERRRTLGIAESAAEAKPVQQVGVSKAGEVAKETVSPERDPAEKRIAESPFGPYRKIRGMEPELLKAQITILKAKEKRTKSEDRDLVYMEAVLAMRQSQAGEAGELPSPEVFAEIARRFTLIRDNTRPFPEAADIEEILARDEAALRPLQIERVRRDWLGEIMQLDEPAVYIAGNPALETLFRERMLALIPETGELPDVDSIKDQIVEIAGELYLSA